MDSEASSEITVINEDMPDEKDLLDDVHEATGESLVVKPKKRRRSNLTGQKKKKYKKTTAAAAAVEAEEEEEYEVEMIIGHKVEDVNIESSVPWSCQLIKFVLWNCCRGKTFIWSSGKAGVRSTTSGCATMTCPVRNWWPNSIKEPDLRLKCNAKTKVFFDNFPARRQLKPLTKTEFLKRTEKVKTRTGPTKRKQKLRSTSLPNFRSTLRASGSRPTKTLRLPSRRSAIPTTGPKLTE